MKDFEMQTFSVGGHGGSGKDTSNSGVRLIHLPSGAFGEGREHRTNTQNKRSAFLKLVNSEKFKKWHKAECAKRMGLKIKEPPAEILTRVDRAMEEDLKSGKIVMEEY